jgi:hypothetical protein
MFIDGPDKQQQRSFFETINKENYENVHTIARVHHSISFAQGNVGDDESRVPRTRRDAQPVDTARTTRVSVDERVG